MKYNIRVNEEYYNNEIYKLFCSLSIITRGEHNIF
jgi:hypothetical protein